MSSSSSSVSSISSSPSPPSASASASGGSLKPSLLVILLILSITLLLSLSLCLLLRLLNRRCLRHLSTTTSATTPTTTPTPSASNRLSCSSHRVSPEISVIDSLPLFTFGSIKRPNHSSSSSSSFSADCAVCLSKFEADDQLRLLPLCCHAFHAHCIDTWLRSNQTCPLCRSPLLHQSSESDLIKALSSPSPPPPPPPPAAASAAAANVIINDHHHPPAAAGGSFRLEIGSLSHRCQAVPDSASPASQERPRRSSYSVGSFEYIVEEGWSEISASATNIHSHSNRRSLCSSSDDKDIINVNGGEGGGQLGRNINDPTGIAVASDGDSEREAGGGRSWLKEYMDRLSSSYSFSISSRALSFRSSGRFFTGSSRRTITPTGNGMGDYDDVEAAAAAAADGVGEEISELFRWFSGV